MEIHKFNYADLRIMPMDEMIEKSSLHRCTDLLETNIKNIPHKGRGIYILNSLTGETLYVGKSECVKRRLMRHLKGGDMITKGFVPFVHSVRVIYVADEVRRQNLFSVERWFITQLNPTFNKN